MRVGDKVKIYNRDELYRNYSCMAKVFRMRDWRENEFPDTKIIYVVKGIKNHLDYKDRVLVHIENEVGNGYIMGVRGLKVLTPFDSFELSEELFLI